ncbi:MULTISPECIES: HEPN domain-containing protein [Nocardia]|uniref:HEPN domain-containing protein n=1 Tax=Nocardia TaxID=1817 RepID=UPI000FDB10BA|nr:MULTISPECIES: HEPN domain-containing protein [Nocardia]MBF6189487.1 hypothetical protein [Nocardia farcinica]MBF6315146.1 hypothetical protein [Nocardia farcinica]MBF6407557.1 hypothetical protein [Nocardia farcinica]UEX23208.1 hypothetical protein LMJ57_01400 [Nocardia farcinica]
MPQDELQLFRQNLTYAEDLVATAVALSAQVTAAINTDDLLRSALVQGVSAFDHFVHEEVRARMILIQQGKLPRPAGFDRFRVSLRSVAVSMSATDTTWLESEIREQHGYLSFQHPDKVADAFRYVTDVSLWQAIALQIGSSPASARRQLKLIVDRRNKIAHEADTDVTPPRTRYPINEGDVRDSLTFLGVLVNAIVTVI